MAIKIPQNMIFGTPNIELITDNKIQKVNYNNNIILGKDNSILKSIYSKTINVFSIPENGDKYEFNIADNGENVELRVITYLEEDESRYFATIDLSDIKSDFYFSSTTPFNKAYFKFDITSYSNDSSSIINSNATLKTETLQLMSSSSDNRGNSLYTKEQSPSDNELYTGGITVFYPIWQFTPYNDSENIFYDYINSKLYVYLGRKSAFNNQYAYVTTSFSFEIFYPIYELNNSNNTIGDLNPSNQYTLETNSFINSYVEKGIENNFVDNQAREIMFNYENGRLRANITCNYGKYMNDDGTIAYNGNDGKVIKNGDIVQLNLSRINKNFEVIKSEVIYSGNLRVNLTLEEESKVFGINEKVDNGASVIYERIYSDVGSNGIINANDKLYEGDIIVIKSNLINSDIYSLGNLYVNGELFNSGNSITIDKNLSVILNTIVNTFSLTTSVEQGATLNLRRISSEYGKANLGYISPNETLYYGDVIYLDWILENNYKADVYLNSNPFYSWENREITIKGNYTITIETTYVPPVQWYTLWSGEYNYAFDNYEEGSTQATLPIELKRNVVTELTFERFTLYNVTQDSGAGDKVNNITREIPFTISFTGSHWNTEPNITFEELKLISGDQTRINVYRTMGSTNGERYIVDSFRLTKIRQYY